ncbi:MAG TPA: hypothetical protein PLE09_01185 [Caldisericia bacterium]|nr:hypothetical protein [Caldisericia bacterium]HXK51153.1 hypothetical protein [Caldisericia bacterium]
MNFWISLMWALYGIPGILTGLLLWKRNPVILDARKHQRWILLTTTVAIPGSLLLSSSLYYPNSFHWTWAIVTFFLLLGLFVWHTNLKNRVISFFYFDKEEFVTELENELRKANFPLPGKPPGRFTFFRQYFTASHKTSVQVEYSKLLNRFTLRLYPRFIPVHFDQNILRRMYEISTNRNFQKVPIACVFYLSLGLSWVVFFIWLAIVSL